MITASDGTGLATRSTGDPANPAILFIHGWSQHMSCWDQVTDRLSDRHHCVTMDLRGHGGSDKPPAQEAYTDTTLWGGDVAAVIEGHALSRPVLVGWSYGSRVIAAYLATHGAAHIAGVVLVGGIVALGKARPDWMKGAATPASDRDLYTDDLSRLIPATVRFVEACTAQPLPRQLFAETVAANMLCPSHVRRALFAPNLDFRNTYAGLSCPGLVIHGTEDIVVPPVVGEAAADLMPNGRYLAYDGTGHAPFLEDPDRFSADLSGFVEDVS